MKKFFVFAVLILLAALCWAGGDKEKDTKPASQNQQQPIPQIAQPQTPPSSSYWTGDGGKGMSLGILMPERQNINKEQEYLSSMVQGVLVANMSKYSAISVLDRVSLDKVIAETLDPTYKDNLDIVRLGNVAHVGNIMTGKIIRTSTGYTLQINVTDTTPNARTLASYSANCTVAELDNHTAIQKASQDLLAQMGIQLTDRSKNELSTANSQQAIDAQTTLARGITAQKSGTIIEALNYYYKAESFDSSLLEASNRASVISTSITSGNIGENVRNEIQQRNEWKKILDEAESFLNSHPFFEIVYDPNLTQGTIDFNKGTVQLSFLATLKPIDEVFKVLQDIRRGLIKTGKIKEWGFWYWPLRGPQIVTTERYYFTAKLTNSDGKILGTVSSSDYFTGPLCSDIGFKRVKNKADLFDINYFFLLNDSSLADPSCFEINKINKLDGSMPARNTDPFKQVFRFYFSNVNANDITDNLTVRITDVKWNNILGKKEMQGYVNIRTGTYTSRDGTWKYTP